MAQEGSPVGKVRHRPEEGELASVVERDQPGEEQAAEELAQHPHR